MDLFVDFSCGPVERRYVALAITGVTCELLLILDGSLEEALAGLARERAVVEAADLVATNGTGAHRVRVADG